MWQIPLHTRGVSVAISPNAPHIDRESMPIQSSLILYSLIHRLVLHRQWLKYYPQTTGIGIKVVKGNMTKQSGYWFQEWKDESNEELPREQVCNV